MSDEAISQAFDALEELLATATEQPDPQAIADWHASFKTALAQAERGPGWAELQARGRILTARLDQQVVQLRALQETVKRELSIQDAGRRALDAYNPPRR